MPLLLLVFHITQLQSWSVLNHILHRIVIASDDGDGDGDCDDNDCGDDEGGGGDNDGGDEVSID